MNNALYLLVFLVAMMYASVGHGGASGYLAVLALYGFSPREMAPSALTLNLLVSGISFLSFWRSGFFKWKLFWPFAITSIPMAFIGGYVKISPEIYGWLLMVALLFAALRLILVGVPNDEDVITASPSLKISVPTGAVVGLLSGMVGVGGGIFLSPLFILRKWADPKQTAAISSCFIWVNSMAALSGHLSRHGQQSLALWPLAVAAFLGGTIGSFLGSQKIQGTGLRRILAGVLTVAAYKMFIVAMH